MLLWRDVKCVFVPPRSIPGTAPEEVSSKRRRGRKPKLAPPQPNVALNEERTEGNADGTASESVPQPESSIPGTAPEEVSSKRRRGRKPKLAPPQPNDALNEERTEGNADGTASESVPQPESSSVSKRKERSYPRRPDSGGTLGQAVAVQVNCWDFEISGVPVHTYDIEPVKVIGDKSGTLKLTDTKLRSFLKEVINGNRTDVFYDGGRLLYSLSPLRGVNSSTVTFRECVPDPFEREGLTLEYNITKKYSLSASQIYEYVNNETANTNDIPQDAVKMVNCLLKWVTREIFVNIGKSALFYPKPLNSSPSDLYVIHSGFTCSVRPQWKVRLNVDTVCKAFFPAGNLADILFAKYEMSMYLRKNWQEMANDINGLRVEASHYKTKEGKSYKRQYTVFGLSKCTSADEKIPDLNMSVETYFKATYDLDLKYPDLPCVKVRKDKEVYIPMELLTVLPYQNTTATKAEVVSAIIKEASVDPSKRFNTLDTFLTEFTQNRHRLLSRFKVNIPQRRPLTVRARELPQPTGKFWAAPKSLGRGKWWPEKFNTAAPESVTWAVFATPPYTEGTNDIRDVCKTLPAVASKCGVKLARGPIFAQPVERARLSEKFNVAKTKGVKLLIFLLHEGEGYAEIKRLGDLYTGLVTQCIKSQTMRQKNFFSVLRNVMLKINGKLGGTNWLVTELKENKLFKNLARKKLVMVMGADVTHLPQSGHNGTARKSVAAVTASITGDLMQYVAIVRQQNRNENVNKEVREVIEGMDGIVADLLKVFRKRNNELPSKIIFYRDGVSEGQFATVLHDELAAIQRACSTAYSGYEPGITFIVVQKHHHIRFKPIDSSENVQAGTVVDTEITHRYGFDFYLCSQEGMQGTSRPAHYQVLYDDNDWSSDSLQCFTYFLCHTYMRCCRSVSYPAPTYYAHLAAFRAREWLKEAQSVDSLLANNRFKVNPNLQDRMFFL
uniref:Protein argonaute-2 n=1 Tax=Mesocestoides corti TaxID=53468 RepID=A0A5K3FU41_MESCO